MSDEEFKRGLQKLLREFDGNAGMAGFVCGRPVELMPQEEQERLLSGFITEENLKILADSQRKLKEAARYDLDEEEAKKVTRAIPVLSDLIEVLRSYSNEELSARDLRQRVRKILHRPLPESQDGLVEAIPKLIEAVSFLAEQNLETKDDWERMIDCSQMHDVLSRIQAMCTAMSASGSGALGETSDLVNDSIKIIESYFKGEIPVKSLQEHFEELSMRLSGLWDS